MILVRFRVLMAALHLGEFDIAGLAERRFSPEEDVPRTVETADLFIVRSVGRREVAIRHRRSGDP